MTKLTAESIIHEWRKGRISASLRDGMLRAEGYELEKDRPRDTDPCDCGPEDGDYGSGYHFESCPQYS